jgi:hypothetical protein
MAGSVLDSESRLAMGAPLTGRVASPGYARVTA